LKVAITGAKGMLGSDVCEIMSGHFEVIPLSRQDFDIVNLDQTVSVIREIKPDYLIHIAAYTDVDGSEHEPEKAYMVNGMGTRNVVIACEEIKCPVIYISSDYIFDGQKRSPYDEWDTPNPINKYGVSKLIGERFVMMFTNRFYIVRTSWLFGARGRNFVDTIKSLLKERDEIKVVDDQVGSPTYTRDLAIKLKELIGRGYGIYHITNSSYCSWYEFACKIKEYISSNSVVTPTTSDRFPRPAKRPAYSVLNNTMLRLEGIEPLRPWEEALKDYLIK